MSDPVGIDAISFYIPRLFVDMLGEFSEIRAKQSGDEIEKLRGKIKLGIGVERMAIADFHEDPATMAAMAAWSLIKKNKLSLNDIGIIAIGTETTVDQSKSMAAYVLGMLERKLGTRASHIGCPQFQFACIGATYALESVLAGIRSETLGRPYGIVIATDIAKYPLMTPGEYTQGAGAVAILVSKNPRLMTINPRHIGTATSDERDFFRPNYSKAAVVDGKYSIDVYLNSVAEALDNYLLKAGLTSQELHEKQNHFLFHVPFPRMGEYAAARFFARLWSQTPTTREWLPDVSWSSTPYNLKDNEEKRQFERELTKTRFFREEFTKKVAPSLALGKEIGNIYSGSLYLALISLLYEAEKSGKDLAGESAVLASYGSGASAKVFAGTFGTHWRETYSSQEVFSLITPQDQGGRRQQISLASYEKIHESSESNLIASTLNLQLGQPINHSVYPAKILAALSPLIDTDSLVSIDWPKPSIGPKTKEFSLEKIGKENSKERVDVGYRYYEWID